MSLIACVMKQLNNAKHLQQAGVKVMLIQTKGTVHGFELNWKSACTQAIIRQRIAYMKEQFSK